MPPELEIPPIREIVPPPPPEAGWPLWAWLAVAAAALLCLAAAVVVVALVRRRRAPAAVPGYDARASALGKLHALKETYLEHPAPEFALAASHGMREYLTAFYGGLTPFETGAEFLDRQHAEHRMDGTKFATVKDLYERAEALKFAPAPGADSLRLELVEDMIAFVRDDVPGPKLQLHPARPHADPVSA